MGRQINTLSARGVLTLAEPGRHSDGGGLYLVVDPSGAKRWLFMFRQGSVRKEMGLGSLSAVTLAEARDKAAAARKLVDAGANPIEVRKEAEALKESAATFGEFADALIPTITKGFRNAKHREQWPTTLKTHAASLRPMKAATPAGGDDRAAFPPSSHNGEISYRGREVVMPFAALEDPVDVARAHAAFERAWAEIEAHALQGDNCQAARDRLADIVADLVLIADDDDDLIARAVKRFRESAT